VDENLYNKNIVCPVCGAKLDVTKVKAKGCKVASRDTDYCVYYEDLNPLFYNIWVCEFCGYAAQEDKFETIIQKDRAAVKETISPHWTRRSFTGERNVDNAIEVHKLALYNLQVRKANASEFAKVCIRIAWLFRLKKDEKENEFLQFALNCYSETYEKESFPADKLDEYTCMYMIAELSRRLGKYDDAIKWFSKIMGSPDARKNRNLLDNVREQYELAKEQMKNAGQTKDIEPSA
jgi:uncharacterized protein (DUF2225 family)